eukprot:1327011-Rhodomonas_salina.1
MASLADKRSCKWQHCRQKWRLGYRRRRGEGSHRDAKVTPRCRETPSNVNIAREKKKKKGTQRAVQGHLQVRGSCILLHLRQRHRVRQCRPSHRIASHRIASHRIASHRIRCNRAYAHVSAGHCVADAYQTCSTLRIACASTATRRPWQADSNARDLNCVARYRAVSALEPFEGEAGCARSCGVSVAAAKEESWAPKLLAASPAYDNICVAAINASTAAENGSTAAIHARTVTKSGSIATILASNGAKNGSSAAIFGCGVAIKGSRPAPTPCAPCRSPPPAT